MPVSYRILSAEIVNGVCIGVLPGLLILEERKEEVLAKRRICKCKSRPCLIIAQMGEKKDNNSLTGIITSTVLTF